MKHETNIEYDVLGWVKPELDELLDRARQSLESYIENGHRDEARLKQVYTLIRQVRGTLQVVNLAGAVMLADEMESLTDAFLHGRVTNIEVGLGVLSAAILQLPDYLEYVQSGYPDTPIVILSLLNDLRAARDAELLSESVVFLPDIESDSAMQAMPIQSGLDPATVAKGKRQQFQLGLIDLFNNRNLDQAMVSMCVVVSAIEESSGDIASRRFWWVVGAMLEGISRIEVPEVIKLLLGKVDREIGRLAKYGEAEFVMGLGDELLKNILFYVARAEEIGPRVEAVRQAYHLDELLPRALTLEAARKELSAPNLKLLEAVSSGIREDLAEVRDRLEVITRADDKSSLGEFAALADRMRRIGDTLGMLGLSDARDRVEKQAKEIQHISQGSELPGAEQLLGLAEVMWAIEDSLKGLFARRRGDMPLESYDGSMQEVTAAGIREVLREISQIKEALVDYLEISKDLTGLQVVPERLRAAAAALSMMGVTDPVDEIDAIRSQFEALLAGRIDQTSTWLDLLAEAITAIEMYLEGRASQRPGQPALLQHAENVIADLQSVAGNDVTTIHQSDELSQIAGYIVDELSPPANLSEFEDADWAFSENPEEEQSKPVVSVKTIPLPSSTDQSESDDHSIVDLWQVLKADADPEILEVFLEEASEEQEKIIILVNRWRADWQDVEALKDLRRSFHTLKGSGRLAGAECLGEFSWCFENMLNQVLEQRVPAQKLHISLLEEAIPALGKMIDQLKGDASDTLDIRQLASRALNFDEFQSSEVDSEVEGIESEIPDSVDADELIPEQTLSEEGGDETAISAETGFKDGANRSHLDPILLDIYMQEARQHFLVVEDFLREAHGGAGPIEIPDEFLRAIHTINGSAQTAGVPQIHEVFTPLEAIVKHLMVSYRGLTPSLLDLFDAANEGGLQVLEALADDQVELPDTHDIRDRALAVLEENESGVVSNRDMSQSMPPLHENRVPDSIESLDPELVGIFLDEADELIKGAEKAVGTWQSGAEEPHKAISMLQRELHTLKGGARMAEFITIGDLTHALETRVAMMAEASSNPEEAGFELLHMALDRLGDMLEQARKGGVIYPQMDMVRRLAAYGMDAPNAAQETASDRQTDKTGAVDDLEASHSSPVVLHLDGNDVPEAEREGRYVGNERLRVDAALLDDLVNHAGEVNIYHARLKQQVVGLSYNLTELRQTSTRLQEQLRKLEVETEAQILFRHERENEQQSRVNDSFDPLELDRYSNMQQLSRALAESVSDLSSIEELMADELRDAETLLLQQARVSSELQDGLMRTRMLRVSELTSRLVRVVRQTANDLNKQVALDFEGTEHEVDRTILNHLMAPLQHMLRNAVAHGIEKSQARRAAGKPEKGHVGVHFRREGNEIVVIVEDDGRGIDIEAVKSRARAKGLIAENADLNDEEALHLILETGFSTADEISQIAGRGIGMDVVAREVRQLGGVLSIASEQGKGAAFTLRLPFTLTITQALLAQSADELYAVPLTAIEGVVRLPARTLAECFVADEPSYEYLGNNYRLKRLDSVFGYPPRQVLEQQGVYRPLLMLRSGEQRIALMVDGLMGSREVVVKSLGAQFAKLRGVAGATILGDGRVVLILDVPSLVRLASISLVPPSEGSPHKTQNVIARQTVMVVDDSITIRKFTARMLGRSGYEVMLARDGMDAVAQLDERIPDLILTDIEMPRMDGYELASYLHNDPRFRQVPVIVITSRSGEKHRQRALELGVDRYLGKPYQEQELMTNIRELLSQQRKSG